MKLTLITNNPAFACHAKESGIDRIMLDLESRGKRLRQQGRKLFQSDHTLTDLAALRVDLTPNDVLVRVDPLYSGSAVQVEQVLALGVGTLMLPYFQGVDQVRCFLEIVDGRAAVSLLVETASAADAIDDIVRLPGIAEVHIGLNDMAINLGNETIFDVLVDGTIDRLALSVRAAGIAFGFGGLARVDALDLPVSACGIISENVRLGSQIGLLGRSFRQSLETDGGTDVRRAVGKLREVIQRCRRLDTGQLEENRALVARDVRRWAQLRAESDSSLPTKEPVPDQDSE